jgi:hypothetical protein
MDMLSTIIPKSDQLNADDLIGAPRTIKITACVVRIDQAQPVAISFEGDNGKPYKPCKGMRRILVQLWGPDSKNYVGRSLTLCRDDEVVYAGVKVGGIRISHMSDIKDDVIVALTISKAKRVPLKISMLAAQAKKPTAEPHPMIAQYESCPTMEEFTYLEKSRAGSWSTMPAGDKAAVKAASEAAKARLLVNQDSEPPAA